MNLWARLFLLLLRAPFGPRLRPPTDVSRMRLRVLPNDLDTSLHMNNGRYLSVMDLGRLDLILRSGLWRAVLRERWTPILGGAIIRFRRELRAFQPYCLETRILCWSEAAMIIEQRLIGRDRDGAETVHAVGLVRAGLYDRRKRAHVSIERLMEAVGVEAVSPEPSPAVAAFLSAEHALRAVR